MIPVIAVAGWVVLVLQIAGLCAAAQRGDTSMGKEAGDCEAHATAAGSEPPS